MASIETLYNSTAYYGSPTEIGEGVGSRREEVSSNQIKETWTTPTVTVDGREVEVWQSATYTFTYNRLPDRYDNPEINIEKSIQLF